MTRPILHRQSGLLGQYTNAQPTGNAGKQPSETAGVSDSGHSRRWTDAKAYRPDLYASLAAVTLPDSGSISRRDTPALTTPFRGTVARKATDLSWANAVPAPRHSGFAPSRNLRSVSAIRRVSAFAIDALMWAVFSGCFALLASGAL